MGTELIQFEESLKVLQKTNLLGKELTVFGTPDDPLFLAKEIAEWIEHSNVTVMLQSIDDDEKGLNIVYTLGGNQEMWTLTEDGLYEVLMQSRKPVAKKFKKEVKKILHELRTKGSFHAKALPQSYAEALRELASTVEENERLLIENQKQSEKIEQKDKVIENQSKYVSFAKNAFDSDSEVDIGKAAKILSLGYGRNTLFKKLREDGILMSNNEPKQKYITAGYFRLTQLDPIDMGPGKPPLIKTKVLVRQKGLAFLNLRYGKKTELEMYKQKKVE